MSAKNAVWRRAIAVAGLGIFTLAYAELFIRLLAPQPIMPRYVTGTSYGVRGNIPNAHYRHTTSEVDVDFKINSQGMRADRDFPFEKSPGTCRVAIFGDSFFMGYELNYEDTFARQLEKRLRAEGLAAEVLNFAVSGFGTAEMLRAYESQGQRFDPDLVIFEWHSTDPNDNVRSGLYRLAGGTLTPTNRSYLPSIGTQDALLRWRVYRLIADNSHLYSLVRESAAKLAKKMLVTLKSLRTPMDAEAADEPDDSGDESADGEPQGNEHSASSLLSAAILKRAQDTVEHSGQSFYVLEIPLKESRTTFKSSLAVLPAEQLSGMEIISPLSAFRALAAPDRKIFFEHGQGHITPIAVEAIVAVAVPKLLADPRLQNCRTVSPAPTQTESGIP